MAGELKQEYRGLIVSGNRALARSLLSHGLIDDEQMEGANEKLIEAIEAGNPRQMSLLNILMFEIKAFTENEYLDFVIREFGIGLLSLRNIILRRFENELQDPDRCWATWTTPFDQIGDYLLVATAYYPSEPIVQHWEKLAEGRIVWYGVPADSIAEAIDRVSRADGGEGEGDA